MAKKQILIVDDDLKTRDMLKELLEIEDYEVILAEKASQALDKYLSYFFDLVICGVTISDVSGIELLKELKKIDEDAIVIFLTDKDDIEIYKQAIRYGATDFLDKPPEISELLKSLERGIEKRTFSRKIKSYHEGLERIVEDRTELLKLQKEALEKEQQRTESIIQEAHIGMLILDGESEEIFMINKRGKELFRLLPECENRYFLKKCHDVFPEHIAKKIEGMTGEIYKERAIVSLGTFNVAENCIIYLVGYPVIIDKSINSIVVVAEDVTERTILEKQILQSSRLAGIGELAAGVAHEINNPVAFVSSNTYMLGKYFDKILELLKAYEELEWNITNSENNPDIKEKVSGIIGLKQALKIERILKNVKEILEENVDGLNRVKKIVLDLKTFSYMGDEEAEKADINKVMDDTLNLVWNEIKYKAEVVRQYGTLPEIFCFPRQISQVFTNVLVNAAHAINEKGVITIKTFQEGNKVKIAVTDTGCGMDESVVKKIFEPFFSTKGAGKGTGLGLSVAYRLIEKHEGSMEVETELDKGTTFTITLPLEKKSDRKSV